MVAGFEARVRLPDTETTHFDVAFCFDAVTCTLVTDIPAKLSPIEAVSRKNHRGVVALFHVIVPEAEVLCEPYVEYTTTVPVADVPFVYAMLPEIPTGSVEVGVIAKPRRILYDEVW